VTEILPICSCFQVGETLTLRKIALVSSIEEIHESPRRIPSVLDAGVFCPLFPYEKEVSM
jgi:hypothetical protein